MQLSNTNENFETGHQELSDFRSSIIDAPSQKLSLSIRVTKILYSAESTFNGIEISNFFPSRDFREVRTWKAYTSIIAINEIFLNAFGGKFLRRERKQFYHFYWKWFFWESASLTKLNVCRLGTLSKDFSESFFQTEKKSLSGCPVDRNLRNFCV